MSTLSILVLLPLFVGGLLAMGYLRPWARALALAVSAVSLWQIYGLWQRFESGLPTMQFREFRPLFGSVNISWNLGVDGWNLTALVCSVLIMTAMVIASDEEERSYSGWLLLLSACAMGVIMSLNFVLTLFFLLVFVIAVAFALQENSSAGGRVALKSWLGGGGLMWGLFLVFAVSVHSVTDGGSYNFAAIIREQIAYSTQVWQLGLMLAGMAALVGLFPFSGWHEQVIRRLPLPLVVIFLTAAGTMTVVFCFRLVLPVYQEVVAANAGKLMLIVLSAGLYASAAAWIRDDLRGQLAHLTAAATALAVAALFLLKTRGSLGAVTFSGTYFLAIAAAGVLCLWLERTVGGAADWWVIKHQVPKSPSLRFYAILVFFALGVFPLAASFPGALLFLLEAGEQAIRALRTEGAYLPMIRASLFLSPLFVMAVLATQYLWFAGQKKASVPDYALAPRLRETTALLLLLGCIFYWGLKPQQLSRQVESSIAYTYKQRLSGERPVRAPVHEVLPEEVESQP